MVRRIIEINEERCNGCGACAKACHEGAIGMVDGKAKLMRDDYCDGLGDCLPNCPTGAIRFVEREAAAYDEAAVLASKAKKLAGSGHGCPGSASQSITRGCPGAAAQSIAHSAGTSAWDMPAASVSELRNWPPQMKLCPIKAPYFEDAELFVAADCTAYARADLHARFMRGRVTLIGCPKLDETDYSEKLSEILRQNTIRGITLARMVVPCCGGLEHAVRRAIELSGKDIPLQIAVIGLDGTPVQ